MGAQTLYDKLWDIHRVEELPDGSTLLYIDRHLLHEVTSPQAFSNLRLAQRKPWRVDTSLATPDHNVPTLSREQGINGITDHIARQQIAVLESNSREFNIPLFALDDMRQGIVHVVGPEQGLTLPGMTLVCGDSHTATHGALAALAHGIGSSEVEHVLATQTLRSRKLKNFRIRVEGRLALGVSAKDVALYIIGVIGTAGGNGHALEFCGPTIDAMSMEARMTLCNMSIEAGADRRGDAAVLVVVVDAAIVDGAVAVVVDALDAGGAVVGVVGGYVVVHAAVLVVVGIGIAVAVAVEGGRQADGEHVAAGGGDFEGGQQAAAASGSMVRALP